MATDWADDDTMSSEETMRRFEALGPEVTALHGPAVNVECVRILSDTITYLRFSDGCKSAVNLKPLMVGPIFDEVFAKNMFNDIKVDADSGTVVWPNGADIAPEVLRYLSNPIATCD